MMHAVAYENFGRWVVDCPNPDDMNAWTIPRGTTEWECQKPVGCGEHFTIDWPDPGHTAAAPTWTDEDYRAAAERDRASMREQS